VYGAEGILTFLHLSFFQLALLAAAVHVSAFVSILPVQVCVGRVPVCVCVPVCMCVCVCVCVSLLVFLYRYRLAVCTVDLYLACLVHVL